MQHGSWARSMDEQRVREHEQHTQSSNTVAPKPTAGPYREITRTRHQPVPPASTGEFHLRQAPSDDGHMGRHVRATTSESTRRLLSSPVSTVNVDVY